MRRRLLLLSALVAAAAIAVGTGGYSSVGADRGMSVGAANDVDAYLSLDYADEDVSANSSSDVTKTFVTVENQFREPVEVWVNYTVMDPSDSTVSEGTENKPTLDTSNTFDVTATFTCDADGEYTITFDATAESDSFSVETTTSRTVTYAVTCT